MTKSPEKGRNEIADEALREAARTGTNVCVILARMLKAAKRAGDIERRKKIVMAQKFLRCRNRKKRRSQ
jgi:hypothetical protein